MRALGYVVSERKITLNYAFLTKLRYGEGIPDESLPVLYVGWEKVKNENLPYKSIIDKQLSDNTFWTFSRSEDRSQFEIDLKKFSEYCINNASSKVIYHYMNPFDMRYTQFKYLVSIVNDGEEPVYVSSDGMVYIPHNGMSLGISFIILDYCGINKVKAYHWLKSRRRIITDKDVSEERRLLQDKKYAIPFAMWSV